MEAIAEINDLACRSIELGDYQVALDVLNSCLGCVKQLKRFRKPVSEGSNTTHTEARHSASKASISRLLKGAKQKLLARSRIIVSPGFVRADKRERSTAKASIMRQRKRRRRHHQNDLHFHTSSTESSNTSSESTIDPSQQSTCSFAISHEPITISSLNNDNSCTHGRTPAQDQEEMEERYFVYRKPLRLSKFQWSQITECYCRNDQRDHKNKNQIAREVELAVSANLIFNIALSHHLIANSTKKELARNIRYNPGLSPDSGDDTDDDDDENGFDEDDMADALQTKQRLKGALRLYELGFRVHTKRVAFVMTYRSQSSRRRMLNSTASIPSLSPLPSISTSIPTSVRRVSLEPTDETPLEGGDREDELKSATRFVLALLNNCAQIHEALGQIEKAQVFQKRLLSFLLVIVDSGESIHDIVGDGPAVDGYLKNVLARTVFDRKTAPAAMA
mmetsp:Transcript_1195/g.2594  ORF Transcript_1195/g.2594 Transcript_1195/m.2594 type:complete len:449 (-) Transcript_1195:247-1593(-)